MKSAAKLLRFPLGGLAKDGSYRDTTYPTEESVYSTPMAKNVIGECPITGRLRGGSRPGLKELSGVTASSTAKWLWPNGDGILIGSGYTPWTVDMKVPYSSYQQPMFEPGEGRWYLYWFDESEIEDYAVAEGTASSVSLNFHSEGSSTQIASCTRSASEDLLVFGELSKATLPDGSNVILQHPPMAVYRDRVVKASGATWMASRTGDHGDFDFGGEADDVTKACAGTVALAGREGEAITAIAAFGDARLFVATRRALAVMVGEPTTGMSILSENVGIVSADAWCNADGVLYFIGPNGLYAVADGAPMLVSQRIPKELRGLSSALLVWDPRYRGIHIFTTGTDYFYDADRKAFWPVEYPATMRPDAAGKAMIGGVNRVLFHCADGKWRHWDEDSATDDGVEIVSQVAIGPFKCGVAEGDGMLDEIDVTLAENSATVSLGVKTAHTAEAAADGTGVVLTNHYFTEGYNPCVRTRTRGAWATLFIASTGKWAYESIYARIKTFGRLRP